MEESKSLFASRTFWGAVLMMLSSTLAYFGVDFGAEEQANLAYGLADIGGFILTIWGRISARKSIAINKDSTAAGFVAALALVSCLSLPACAVRDLPASEQAMSVVNEGLSAYESLHQEYLNLHMSLPEQRDFLEDRVAPALDATKLALVSLGDATALWERAKSKPEDWDALKIRAMSLLYDVMAMLTKLKGAGA